MTVTCLMPGATETEFFERADMLDTKVGQAEKDDPRRRRQGGFDAMMRGEGDVVSGWQEQAAVGDRQRHAGRHARRAASSHGRAGLSPKMTRVTVLEDAKKLVEKATGWRRVADPTELADLIRKREPRLFRFKDDGVVPNHPRWPLVIYRNAVKLPAALDPAAVFEDLFEQNGWREILAG